LTLQFFEKVACDIDMSTLSAVCDQKHIVYEEDRSAMYVLKRPNKDMPAPRSLEDIIGVHHGGPSSRRLGEPDHSLQKYQEFLAFVK
jgi:hypothetical protein